MNERKPRKERSEEYERFEDFAKKLLRVTKEEVDAKRKEWNAKRQRR